MFQLNVIKLTQFYCVYRIKDGHGSECRRDMREDSWFNGQAADSVCHQTGRYGGNKQRRHAWPQRMSGTIQVPPMELHGRWKPKRIRACRRLW